MDHMIPDRWVVGTTDPDFHWIPLSKWGKSSFKREKNNKQKIFFVPIYVAQICSKCLHRSLLRFCLEKAVKNCTVYLCIHYIVNTVWEVSNTTGISRLAGFFCCHNSNTRTSVSSFWVIKAEALIRATTVPKGWCPLCFCRFSC